MFKIVALTEDAGAGVGGTRPSATGRIVHEYRLRPCRALGDVGKGAGYLKAAPGEAGGEPARTTDSAESVAGWQVVTGEARRDIGVMQAWHPEDRGSVDGAHMPISSAAKFHGSVCKMGTLFLVRAEAGGFVVSMARALGGRWVNKPVFGHRNLRLLDRDHHGSMMSEYPAKGTIVSHQ